MPPQTLPPVSADGDASLHAGAAGASRSRALRWVGRIGAVLLPAAAILLPLLNHVALVSGRWLTFAAVLTLLQVLVIAAILLRRMRGVWRVAIVGAVALLLLARSWSVHAGIAAGAGLSHAVLYASLLAYFGGSLRPGRTDVVSGLARRLRRDMRADMLAYTRAVTRAWCLFFAGQLLGSALLWLTAPVAVWSFFVNVLDLPLVIAMFVGEYAVRLVRFRHDEHAGFLEMVRAWRAQAADRPQR